MCESPMAFELLQKMTCTCMGKKICKRNYECHLEKHWVYRDMWLLCITAKICTTLELHNRDIPKAML